MKKIFSLSLLCTLGLMVAGCATTGAENTTTANTPLTLEEALQKSAETRQKILDAKEKYQNIKNAAATADTATNGIAGELAKQAVQYKIDSAKKSIEAEKEAWKEIFAD